MSRNNGQARNTPGYTKYQPRNHSQMAALYGISCKTFTKWLEPHLAYVTYRVGNIWQTEQIRRIYERLGEPDIEW